MDTNHTLSDVQKPSYLKGCLHGEAAQAISHLPLSSGNYAVGFKMLKDRYANKRLILHSHLDAIFNIPRIHQESAEQLKKFIIAFDENCLALEALNFKVQPDYMWVHVLTERLDPASRRQWEVESSGSTDLKSIDELRNFNCRVQALEAPNNYKATNNEKVAEKQVNYAERRLQSYKSSLSQCVCCSATDHQLYQCSKFLAMDVNARNELVRRNKLCFNCMRKGHGTKDCKSKGSCKQCAS